MSHFLAYVLIPSNTEDVELKASELLAPYDVDLDGEPHDTECGCVWNRAFSKALEVCELRYGVNKAATEESDLSIAQKSCAGTPSELDRLLNTPRRFLDIETKRQIPTTPPEPDCEECNGKGVATSTDNQNAKWDWWEIGGSWDGIFKDFWKDGSHHDLDGNLALVRDLNTDKLPIPHAIVTPDGAWHPQGGATWFAAISNLHQEWDSEVRAIMSEHEDCLLLVVSCHE